MSVLSKEHQLMLQKTSELWKLYINHQKEAGDKKGKHGGYKATALKDDDLEDFRNAIHTIQRIIQSKALRHLEDITLPEMIKREILATHPGAHSFDIKVNFKDTTHETRSKSAVLDIPSDHMYITDNGKEDEKAVNLMAGSPSDDDDDDY
jgi:hypothetical protein